jgi:hypothetical protein
MGEWSAFAGFKCTGSHYELVAADFCGTTQCPDLIERYVKLFQLSNKPSPGYPLNSGRRNLNLTVMTL